MNREELYQLLEKGPVILDGATGSNLQKEGLAPGICPERWILEHEEIFLQLQRSYVTAGAQIIYAPTFTANRVKLAEYGLEDQVGEMNHRLLALSKKAAGQEAYVAGNLTMTGVSLEPIGPMTMEKLIDIYKEQAAYLQEAGCDLFVVETMMSLAETRAAVIAIKEVSQLPLMVTMTFQEDGRTLYGTDPVTAVVVLQSLGADVIGINCSTGPEEMLPLIRRMKDYADVPIMVKANAGLPLLQDGRTVYPMGPEEFAGYGPAFVEAGAAFLGGCCGTTPEHIRLLAESVRGMQVRTVQNLHPMMLASERSSQEIRLGGQLLIIGERINPTGKKALQAELREGRLDLVEEMAVSQEERGAHILDINMGTNGIDEREMMRKAIEKVTMVSSLPLCIDSSYVEVIEEALRVYPGRALINSISLETEKIEKLLPLVKKYGAMFILLPLSQEGLPKSLEEKIRIIHKILNRAHAMGIRDEQIIVDGLVSTVGANKKAALETLETIRYCSEELHLCTTVGLSNISFGLPERSYVNGAFVSMAVQSGLTMAIANPSNDLLMGMSFAADLLRNKEGADLAYIRQIQGMKKRQEIEAAEKSKSQTAASLSEAPALQKKKGSREDSARQNSKVFQAVVKGNGKRIISQVKSCLAQGISAKAILDDMLIPGINEVGRLFDIQEYFLPQLIASATTMEKAIHYLEPMLQEGEEREKKPVIVIATVEGDIHDIGKNLVALMLKNYGYQVIDLGKDVPAAQIIEAAQQHKAAVIALSALMTTTMMRMKEVVALRNEKKLSARIIIGGAVTTPSFAQEIGADGYSADAADAVRLVDRLLKE